MKLRITSFLLFLFIATLNSQSFTKITDPENDVTGQPSVAGYAGASWIDYDGDGWLDLFVNSNFLYRNDQDGSFTRVDFSGVNTGDGNGNTWGDIDNDGDLDVVIAASPTKLFLNDSGSFTEAPITSEEIDTFNFWSAALGDYNEDGWLDLFLCHPAGFLPFSGPISRPSLLMVNNGDGSFTRHLNTPVDDELAAHTVGSWTDFDLDGDLDLFVGSGEVSFGSRDHIYINQLSETDTARLVRLLEGPLAEDIRDGQNWNWIDYDNDGDLDGFVTNYRSPAENDLYRNDNGSYVRQTEEAVGTIADQGGAGLTNVWADFDNDGFLDCFVAFDANQKDRLYKNQGDGTFVEEDKVFSITGSSRGAAAGDYNNDGFVDLFIVSASSGKAGLFRNNGITNNWASFSVAGTTSNRSGIGARLWAKATVNGQEMWQTREINSQNSFNGHNSYRAHFGLGDATVIDSLIVEWPSGIREIYTELESGRFCTLSEGEGMECLTITDNEEVANEKVSVEVAPNITKGGIVNVNFSFPVPLTIELSIYDLQGRKLPLKDQQMENVQAGQFQLEADRLAPGMYLIELLGGNFQIIKKLIIQ